MYFPDGTTFQYFFFDTYIGRKLFSCIFVCYITGLMTSGFPPFVRSFDGRTANIKRASAFR